MAAVQKLSQLVSGAQDLAERISRKPFLAAIQRSLALPLPLIMVGAFALLFRYPPFTWLQAGDDTVFGAWFNRILDYLIAGTFGISALVILFGFSFVLTSQQIQNNNREGASPIIAAIVVMSCFFIVTAPTDYESLKSALALNEGLLVALFVSAAGGMLFLYLANLKFLRLPVKSLGNDPLIGDVFMTLPAGMITIIVFAGFKTLLVAVDFSTGVAHVADSALASFGDNANSLGFALLYAALTQVLWFFGMHGPNMLHSVEKTVLIPATEGNLQAIAIGQEPANIFTSQFFDFFVRMGGSGSTLCLILALLIASGSLNSRRFALFALLPAVCNVNEPLLFGIPLVLNPVYAIPFIAVPVVQTLIGYVAIIAEWMPKTSFAATWTTPAILSGYVVTGSYAGALVQIVALTIGTALYIPFVRFSERLARHRGDQILSSLLKIAESRAASQQASWFFDQAGEERRVAVALSQDLDDALRSRNGLFLEFQPQLDINGQHVYGVEALLRWKHDYYGRVAPPITVALAEDIGKTDELGFRVLEMACRQRMQWSDLVPKGFVMSVNVAPKQLLRKDFDEEVIRILNNVAMSPRSLELEITESTALLPDVHAIDALKRLRRAGVRIALDDFGMGHTSLHYLRELPLDTVKIDRSLTELSGNEVEEHIIRSIIDLSRSLDISTIVEGVEHEEQLQRLCALGCRRFQGYYFSRPLSAEDIVRFIGAHSVSRSARDLQELAGKPALTA
jgi:PTS system cellobiose-specific IIC component